MCRYCLFVLEIIVKICFIKNIEKLRNEFNLFGFLYKEFLWKFYYFICY